MNADVESPMTPEVKLLVHQAAAMRLVALLFSAPTPESRNEVQALLAEVTDQVLKDAAQRWLDTMDSGRYFACVAPAGPISLRLISYLSRISPGDILAELESCYAAFGYAPSSPEPPDHLAVQADFVAFLFLKWAYAVARCESTTVGLLRKTCKRFSGEFLAPILEDLPQKLSEAQVDCLARAADWLKINSRVWRNGCPEITATSCPQLE